jgi:hypothetical protein
LWTAVDEAGVELDEFGTSDAFRKGVFGGENSAGTDDGDIISEMGVELADDFGGMLR